MKHLTDRSLFAWDLTYVTSAAATSFLPHSTCGPKKRGRHLLLQSFLFDVFTIGHFLLGTMSTVVFGLCSAYFFTIGVSVLEEYLNYCSTIRHVAAQTTHEALAPWTETQVTCKPYFNRLLSCSSFVTFERLESRMLITPQASGVIAPTESDICSS